MTQGHDDKGRDDEGHDDRGLAALGERVAVCRDRARDLRQDMLTYHLDMAVVALGVILPDLSIRQGIRPSRTTRSGGPVAVTKPDAVRPAELVDLRTMIEGCRDRAVDLDRSLLAYMLDVAAVTVSTALADRV